MSDFDIVSVPAILATPVTTYDASGNKIADDGEWHRQGAEAQYVLAEFLVEKGLVAEVTSVPRSPNLTIKFSALTDEGRAFAREAVHKWLVSVDRPVAKIDDRGLQRRWDKFKAKD
jgi:hypothetical protein